MSTSSRDARAGVLTSLSASVILAWGWPRRLFALASGAIGALAMPPFGFFPALIVSLVVAVWLIDGSADRGSTGALRASLRSAFAVGWIWGFGYFVASLWWLGAAFLVDDRYAWLLPLGVVALPAALAIFFAIGFALARLLWTHGAWRILSLTCGLAVAEWLRAVVLSGFPWNELGLALGQSLTLMQTASIIGQHGLTLLATAVAAAPATLGDERGIGRWLPTGLAALAVAAMAIFGAMRLSDPDPAPDSSVKLRLLQTNISQGADFGPERGPEILSRYLSLSDRAVSPERSGVSDVTLLVWPESAFPFILSRQTDALARISEALKSGAVLATGAASADDRARPRRYFNSILLLDRSGLLPERYDKRHLVPFGEYVPFQALFRAIGLYEFVHFPGGFEPGSGSDVLSIPGAPPALAMICYEAIFPSEWGGARAGDEARARWILNLTDDAWFGLTPGPYQHFALAKLRSVEWGLPMARSANGGFSAIVDAKGRVIASAPLGVETVIDGVLPGALAPPFAARWGSAPFAVGLLVIFALLGAVRAIRR